MPPEAARDDGAVGQVRRLLALRRFAPFSELNPEELAILADQAEERYHPAGTVIFEEGRPVHGTEFILEGAVRVRRHGHDVRVFGAGTSVGGLSSITEDPEGIEAVAEEDTWTLVLPAEDMADVFEENWPILHAAFHGLALEMVEVRGQLGERAGYPADVDPGPALPLGELDLVERIRFMRTSSPFEGGPIESVAELARDARVVRLPAGEPLWSAGDDSGWYLRILHGVVDATADDGRQRFAFGFEDVVGALDSAARIPRWFDARARTEVVALRIETDRLIDVMEDHPELGMSLIRTVAAGIQALLEQLAGHG